MGRLAEVRAIRRAPSLYARPRHPEPKSKNPPKAAGLHTRRPGKSIIWQTELSLTSPNFASPFGVHGQGAPGMQPLPGGLRCNLGGCFALNFRRPARLSPRPAPLGPSGAAASPAPSDSRAMSRKTGRQALARGPAMGSRDAPARPARRDHRPHRARRALRPGVRFPQLHDGPARPVPRQDRGEGGLLSPRRRRRARPAARSRAAELGAPLRGGPRRRGPVPVAAAHQRLRAAADVAMASATATTPRRRRLPTRWARLSASPTRSPPPSRRSPTGSARRPWRRWRPTPATRWRWRSPGWAARSRSEKPRKLLECRACQETLPQIQSLPAPTDLPLRPGPGPPTDHDAAKAHWIRVLLGNDKAG